jgi:hypothetical protein
MLEYHVSRRASKKKRKKKHKLEGGERMGVLEWMKKDLKKDAQKLKHYPERAVGTLLLAAFGSWLSYQGWYWLNLAPPPQGYEYVTDYNALGFIALIVGIVLIATALIIYSTIKVGEEKKE